VNPKVHNTPTPTYPPGSVGGVANANFNYSYTSLLKVLHQTLNGHPDLLSKAIAMMMSLRQQAMDMVSGTDTGNENIGPSFEYQPVNPGIPNFTG
jgi:predicted chitinase